MKINYKKLGKAYCNLLHNSDCLFILTNDGPSAPKAELMAFPANRMLIVVTSRLHLPTGRHILSRIGRHLSWSEIRFARQEPHRRRQAQPAHAGCHPKKVNAFCFSSSEMQVCRVLL